MPDHIGRVRMPIPCMTFLYFVTWILPRQVFSLSNFHKPRGVICEERAVVDPRECISSIGVGVCVLDD
jgi:hypothetical protein